MSPSNDIPGFFFKKKLTVSYSLANFLGRQRLGLCRLFRVAACHTKSLFALGLGRSGKVRVGDTVQNFFSLCFLFFCSVFPFVFVLL